MQERGSAINLSLGGSKLGSVFCTSIHGPGARFGDVSGHLEPHFTPALAYLSYAVQPLLFIAEYIACASALALDDGRNPAVMMSEGRPRSTMTCRTVDGLAALSASTNCIINRGRLEEMMGGCVIQDSEPDCFIARCHYCQLVLIPRQSTSFPKSPSKPGSSNYEEEVRTPFWQHLVSRSFGSGRCCDERASERVRHFGKGVHLRPFLPSFFLLGRAARRQSGTKEVREWTE